MILSDKLIYTRTCCLDSKKTNKCFILWSMEGDNVCIKKVYGGFQVLTKDKFLSEFSLSQWYPNIESIHEACYKKQTYHRIMFARKFR